MAHRFRQFRLLLWKNFILQIRRPIGTVFEILLPILLVSSLIFPKKYLKPEKVCFTAQRAAFSSDDLPGTSKYLAYYPLEEPVASLMENVSRLANTKITNSSVINGKRFSSLSQIVAEVAQNTDKYVGVVVFDVKEREPLPKNVKYTIRLPSKYQGWNTGKTYPGNGYYYSTSYMYSNIFVPLQYAIDMTIIQEKSNISMAIPLKAQIFPQPGYVSDMFVAFMSVMTPLLVTLAFIYSAVSTIKELVIEKKERLKESMKMMGLENWVHWTAWYIKCLLFWGISVVVITIIIKEF